MQDGKNRGKGVIRKNGQRIDNKRVIQNAEFGSYWLIGLVYFATGFGSFFECNSNAHLSLKSPNDVLCLLHFGGSSPSRSDFGRRLVEHFRMFQYSEAFSMD